MPFHFCYDELLMILAAIPFIGILFRKIHNWWHTKFHHKCHEEYCYSDHVEHNPVPKTGGALPPILPHKHSEDWSPITIDKVWDAGNWKEDVYDEISKEDLEERLGPIAEKLIDKLEFDLGANLGNDAFHWFINGYGRVKATFNDRTFLHDEFCVTNTWSEIL